MKKLHLGAASLHSSGNPLDNWSNRGTSHGITVGLQDTQHHQICCITFQKPAIRFTWTNCTPEIFLNDIY